MIQGKWFAPGENLSDGVLPVRLAVFGISGDPVDQAGWNALVFADGEPAATGRIWWEDGVYWLGSIGVVSPLRGRRLGDLTLRLLLYKAQTHAAREIRLICPEDTEGFFSRLGFRVIRRDHGQSEMMVPGSEVSLDSCASCNKQDCPNRK